MVWESEVVFERFTDKARAVVVHAQEAARALGHGHIGTEHLLLALSETPDSTASSALRSLGVDAADTREQVGEIVGYGGAAPEGNVPFTPRAKKVLELSLREALGLRHQYIGSEHILLGLAREGRGVAMQVLGRRGVSAEQVRRAVLAALSSRDPRDLTDAAPERLGHPEARVMRHADLPGVEARMVEIEQMLVRLLDGVARLAVQVEEISRRLPPPPNE